MRRKVAPDYSATGGGEAERQDLLQLSLTISNGEDLTPFVRKAFASGRPESLLLSLRHFASSKESDIEDVCKVHSQDFISAVDYLRSLLSDVDSLKAALSASNLALQSTAGPLLSSLDSYLEARAIARNLSAALSSARLCIRLFDLLARANARLAFDDLYFALRAVDAVERDLLDAVPHRTIRRMLLRLIPAVRSHAERKIAKEFSDWMVRIRVASRHLGQIAIGRASAARQREEELRIKQRRAEEQFRLSLRDANSSIYSLEDDDDDSDDLAAAIDAAGGGGGSGKVKRQEADEWQG